MYSQQSSTLIINNHQLQLKQIVAFEKNLFSKDTYNTLASKNDSRVEIIGVIYLILLLSSFLIIGRFFYISAKINHLSGIKSLKIKPGWAFGWYCIPFANLIMPYRSLKETYKASFNTKDWQSINTPYYFPVWWATFLIGNIVSQISGTIVGSLGESYSYKKLNQISYIDITADILLIINAFFLLKIVKIIFDNQKDKKFELKSKS